jgi:hypothetical protein
MALEGDDKKGRERGPSSTDQEAMRASSARREDSAANQIESH